MKTIIIFLVEHSEIAMFNNGGELTFADLTTMQVSGETEIDCDFSDGQNEMRTFDFTLYPANYIQGKGSKPFESHAPEISIYDFMKKIAKDENFETFTLDDLPNKDYDTQLFLTTVVNELFKIAGMEDIWKIL